MLNHVCLTIVVSQTQFKILLFLQWIMFNYVHSPWSSTKLPLFTALHLQRCIMFNYWVLSFQNCISHKLREHFKMIKPLTLMSPHSSSCSTESYKTICQFQNVYWLKFHILNNRENWSLIYDFNTINKRPMGHIAHLRKQFKTINTYDYIITLIKRRKKKHY